MPSVSESDEINKHQPILGPLFQQPARGLDPAATENSGPTCPGGGCKLRHGSGRQIGSQILRASRMSRRSRRTSCVEMHRKRRSRDFASSAKVASPPSRPLSSASASSGRSQRDLSPCPEHRVSFREQAMAMHLSGRDKHRVMQAVSGKPNMAMGKEPDHILVREPFAGLASFAQCAAARSTGLRDFASSRSIDSGSIEGRRLRGSWAVRGHRHQRVLAAPLIAAQRAARTRRFVGSHTG